MDSRHITRNYLAKASNTRFEVINKWYQNQVEKMDLDILARIFYELAGTQADIIEYTPRWRAVALRCSAFLLKDILFPETVVKVLCYLKK